MTTKVFVDGQEGTTGLRIHEYLDGRSDVHMLRIEADKRKDPAARAELLNAADVAFLCLPDVASKESVSLVTNPNTCIIDASTAYRTHPDWAYGLPELDARQRDAIRASKRISVPGCHASAFILAVHPLVAGGILPPDYPVCCHSLSGYSGGGKKMIEQYVNNPPAALLSPRPYALGLQHKHLPEMKVRGGLVAEPLFTPIVGPYYQGLAVTVFLHSARLNRAVTPAALRDYLAEYYAGERFVRVAPFDLDSNLDQGFFDVQGCNGTNNADLFVFGRDDQIVVMARLDNLAKGASGAAVQSMNVYLGVAEETGLV